ncbi:NUC189-domain-containing protein [Nadsonia fulvescens var. elongata DSM 6958]|uniref:NUC189-domain-containing protein n=1 Tax=Nadsonia fulvescens var. elongata DSM 6958 TaxID=857566 RepID=A0A1E3PIS7_9ASCO|nr:NUC189-domain-containing protein [Nadsonia fulvescens var. elongata DSM 6958]
MSSNTPLISSKFDKSNTLFASAITALDVNKVRVQSVGSDKTFSSELTLDKNVSVQSISWASTTSPNKKNDPKKRKTTESQIDDNQTSVVAIGTNKGEILLYSPAQAAVISTLAGEHTFPVTSFAQKWSCDTNGQIVEWDISKKFSTRSFTFFDTEVRHIKPICDDKLLIASHTIYLVDPADASKPIAQFPGHVSQVHSIIPSNANSELFLTAADNDRFVNIYSINSQKNVGVLVAQSNIKSMTLSESDDSLAVVTEDGLVEIFINPFVASSSLVGRRSAAVSSKASISQFKIVRPVVGVKKDTVFIDNVAIEENQIIVTWVENAANSTFDKIPWRDETGRTIEGLIETTKARQTTIGAAAERATNAIDSAAPQGYAESHAIVTAGNNVAELSSDEENEDEDQDSTLAERLEALGVSKDSEESKKSITSKPQSTDKAPSAGSLTVMLSQALKTNDHSLLEACLASRDETVIKNTIERLDSSLAVKLLERLAEKVSRAPSRSGQLNIWIRWVMVTHGGYLVSLPHLIKTLGSLHITLSSRVSTLPRLLALQGRLEMLNAQMELRHDILNSSKRIGEDDDDEDDEAEVEYIEDDEGVYLNGEDSDDEDDFEEDSDVEDEDMQEDGYIGLDAEIDDGPNGEESEGAYSDLEVDDSEEVEDLSEDNSESEDETETKAKLLKAKAKLNGRR